MGLDSGMIASSKHIKVVDEVILAMRRWIFTIHAFVHYSIICHSSNFLCIRDNFSNNFLRAHISSQHRIFPSVQFIIGCASCQSKIEIYVKLFISGIRFDGWFYFSTNPKGWEKVLHSVNILISPDICQITQKLSTSLLTNVHIVSRKNNIVKPALPLLTIWKWFQCQKFSGNVWLTYVGFLSLVRIYSGRSRPGHPTLKFISLSQFIAAEVKYASISKKVILNSSFEERCKKYWKGHVVLECDNM